MLDAAVSGYGFDLALAGEKARGSPVW